MIIPNFVDEKIVDKNGNLSDSWKQIFSQLITQLQKNLSNEGHVVPSQGTTNIATIFADPDKSGALLYDKDTHQLKVNVNGSVKTITVT